MPVRKKPKAARAPKTKMLHDSESKEHGGVRVTVGIVGPLIRVPHPKSRRVKKSTPKAVKDFLKWALAQL